MIKNGQKQVFDNTHDFLFYTQVCSMGQQVALNYPMVLPKVPTTLKTPYRYPMGHYSHSFVTKKSQKLLKNMFLAIFTSITYYSAQKYILLVNEWCQII